MTEPAEPPPTMTPVGTPVPEKSRLPDAPIERGALDPGAKDPVPEKSDKAGEGTDNATTNARPDAKAGEKPDAKPAGDA